MKKDFLFPLRRLHGWLHEYPAYYKKRRELLNTYIPQIDEAVHNNSKIVFLVLTPEHGNLGDHAIASAEKKFLNEVGISYFEVTDVKLNELIRTKLLHVMNGYPIIINGGGNMGTLWFETEKTHRRIIKNNPKSPIFIFPNTIFYEDTEWGRDEFEKSKKLYNKHKKLYLYARERNSYEIMKNAYNNVKLVPDIVLSLDATDFNCQRKGCLLCLRNDSEKTRSNTEEEMLRIQMQDLFGNNVHDTDMVIKGGIALAQRERELQKKFEEFAEAELVITDRLHGMIFCAITGTPCIVINSKSPKVLGCYEWLKDLNYIQFAESAADITDIYTKIGKKRYQFDNAFLMSYFEILKKDVIENARR